MGEKPVQQDKTEQIKEFQLYPWAADGVPGPQQQTVQLLLKTSASSFLTVFSMRNVCMQMLTDMTSYE